MIEGLVLALLGGVAAASPPPKQASGSPPKEAPGAAPFHPGGNWIVYGGGYEAQSAMDAASIRRDGPIATFRAAQVNLRGPFKVEGKDIDFVVVESSYDCVRNTQRLTGVSGYDRDYKPLWSKRLELPARSAANSSEAYHFMPIACGSRTAWTGHKDLREWLTTFKWMNASPPASPSR